MAVLDRLRALALNPRYVSAISIAAVLAGMEARPGPALDELERAFVVARHPGWSISRTTSAGPRCVASLASLPCLHAWTCIGSVRARRRLEPDPFAIQARAERATCSRADALPSQTKRQAGAATPAKLRRIDCR